jgi:pseudouridine-5'-phosphate glycosidase
MKPIRISDEVSAAVAAGQPVVALESTIFTHGLPRPTNLEVALDAERGLRDTGVVPATVGIVDGVPTVGLSTQQIEALAQADEVVKVSQRDLPVAVVQRLSGGTTVAATAYLAHAAGVRVFSTGGLGGVHRGAETTFDESADLVTLAQTPLLVVSAGVKSILDVPATLERLETLGVTVAGYRTRAYPGFYVADSGERVEYAVESAADAAALLIARDALGLRTAILIANPIARELQLAPDVHDRVLTDALAAARQAGIAGKQTTPYLLDHIQRATGGASLRVNIDVYRANVELGGRIALAVADRSLASIA